MRVTVCIVVAAIGLAAQPALAQPGGDAAAFWTAVQTTCDATAAKPASDLGRRIARAAIAEFNGFGGHRIDANGRLIRFGLTEAEHKREDGGNGEHVGLDHLGWWRVMKYWRALYGTDISGLKDELEVRGYRDAATSQDKDAAAARLATDFGPLLRAAESVADPDKREIMREAIIRAAIIDTPWSAAFISYVMKAAGVTASGFEFANAHRVYIYDAFATSAAEVAHETNRRIYRACPLATTRPRVGDMICLQREPALGDTSTAAVRERIRAELAGGGARTVQRTHCEIVAHIDAPARKMYTIGGNVLNAVTARKLNLRRDLRFSAAQKDKCRNGDWTLPEPASDKPRAAAKCSLNGQNWFVLLQLR